MLPSPSLGPPRLSASLSPAFAPCGMPDELEPPELPLEVDAGGEDPALEECEADEPPPPHPASATAAKTNPRAIQRRGCIDMRVIELLLSHGCW